MKLVKEKRKFNYFLLGSLILMQLLAVMIVRDYLILLVKI